MDRVPLNPRLRHAQPRAVVGSVAYDDIITPPPSGERILGGSASYAALAASYFAPHPLSVSSATISPPPTSSACAPRH